jgi:hypothetical protein
MLWLSSKANPILPETTDCIQFADYLHTKPDWLARLDSSVKRVAQDLRPGTFSARAVQISRRAAFWTAQLAEYVEENAGKAKPGWLV